MSHDMEHPSREPAQAHPHVVDWPVYVAVWITLMVLLVLTYAAAQFDFGAGNALIALVIAIAKTALVVLFFMGVKYSTKLTWIWAGIGFAWLILLFFTLGDYVTRQWVRLPVGW